MRLIPLSQNKYAQIDDADFDFLMQWKWYFGPNGYAERNDRTTGKKLHVRMHRVIMKYPVGKFVDHIDGDKLNNTRQNLRICNKAQNGANMKARIATSAFKGVFWDKKLKNWRAAICFNNRRCFIGNFETEIHAATAYDMYALQLFGQFARTNFTVVAQG